MEHTVCPWCHSEIVWDEEIGPEEHCPHCSNELKGYRTLNISLEEEEADVVEEDPEYDDLNADNHMLNRPFWEGESEAGPSMRTLDKYADDHDLFAFEETVEQLLDEQEEVPECPRCREYMLQAGTQRVSEIGFEPKVFAAANRSVLQPPFQMNVYICTGCFQVQYNLAEDERVRLIEGLTVSRKGQ